MTLTPGLYKMGGDSSSTPESPVGACGINLPLGDDYTTSGTDQLLTSPDDDKDTANNLTPIRASGGPYDKLNIGTFSWEMPDAVESNLPFDNTGNGSTYGELMFYTGYTWDLFADGGTYNGSVTVLLPKVVGGDSLGGSFNYWYNETAWRSAFDGNGSDIIITQDGSVYKDSITAENLVVTYDGVVGQAGGCVPIDTNNNDLLPFGFVDGDLLEGDSQIKLYFRNNATLTKINISVPEGDGPATGDLEIDLRLDSNGLTILSGGVMKILDGEESGTVVPSTLSFVEGDVLLVDINNAIGLGASNLFIDCK